MQGGREEGRLMVQEKTSSILALQPHDTGCIDRMFTLMGFLSHPLGFSFLFFPDLMVQCLLEI